MSGETIARVYDRSDGEHVANLTNERLVHEFDESPLWRVERTTPEPDTVATDGGVAEAQPLEDAVQAVLDRVTKRPGSGEKVFLAVEHEDGEIERVSHEFLFPGQYAIVREEMYE